MNKLIRFSALVVVTLALLLGTVLTNAPLSLAQDSSKPAIKNKEKRQESGLIVKQFERTSSAKEKVWLIYEQATRRVVVVVMQGKNIANYLAQINTPYSDGIEVDLLLAKDSPALAGEALHLRINGSNDGNTFLTKEMQLVFSDQIMSWSAATGSQQATRAGLPYEPPSGEKELRACIDGCVFAESGQYLACINFCIAKFGIK
jgi:hypothetical protein